MQGDLKVCIFLVIVAPLNCLHMQEDCEELRQKVDSGLLPKPTVVRLFNFMLRTDQHL